MLTNRFLRILMPVALVSVTGQAAEIDLPVPGGIVNSIVSLTAETSFTNSIGNFRDFDFKLVSTIGGVQSAEALVDSQGFASALTESNANLEVGVSSFREGSTSSAGIFKRSMVNNSPNPVTIGFEFVIPAGRLTLVDFSNPSFQLPEGPTGGVLAMIEFGFGIGPLQEIFAFATQAHVDHGSLVHSEEGPITVRSVGTHSGEHALAIDEYRGRVLFPSLLPGETLNFVYTMSAFGFNGIIEYGYLINLGDPGDFTAAGNGSVFISPALAPVPEPHTFLLSGLGLSALIAMRRRRG